MFKPVFRYTDVIVNNLVDIYSAREVIIGAPLVPKWEVSLRREALVRSAHASNAIEGNPLSLKEVSLLAEGREVSATRRAKQEVLNYLQVLKDLERYQQDGAVTEATLLALHRGVTRDVLEDPRDEGRFRKVQVVVGDARTGEVTYRPPPPGEVPGLTRALLGWLGSDDARRLNPVLVAGIAHYELVRIHPFVDGNGRTSRALATLVLSMRQFDIKRFFALDDYYDSDRPSYYQALSRVDAHRRDLTGWLEYFTAGVLVSISGVRQRIIALSLERRRTATKGQVALSDRQMDLVEMMLTRGSTTSREVANRYRITRQAALKELRGLISLGVVRMEGMGRTARFVLV